MNNLVTHLLIVLLPMILSNVVHMIIVKRNALSFLNVPIWETAFGKNKTWRGMILLPLLNAAFLSITDSILQIHSSDPIRTGLILGVAYMISELPNSLLKRRMGIASGASHPHHRILFSTLDKTDSAFGVTLAYYLLHHIDIQGAVLLFLACSITHISISLILVNLKLKERF